MEAKTIGSNNKNVAVLLRRIEHVDNDYDVFVIVEESVETVRYKATFNAIKFFSAGHSSFRSTE